MNSKNASDKRTEENSFSKVYKCISSKRLKDILCLHLKSSHVFIFCCTLVPFMHVFMSFLLIVKCLLRSVHIMLPKGQTSNFRLKIK